MAQASISFSNLARSTTTTQILMVLASIGLHYLVANNLSWFGRLDPIKLKPAGGTVKVVDLTPAEQTRVPEAVKSNPLPIAPIPVNPEPATRFPGSPLSFGSPGTSVLMPPQNRSPLPPPSSQIPRQPTQLPNPLTNSTSKRSEIPIVPKPLRSSQPDREGRDNADQGSSAKRSRPPRKTADPNSTPDTSGNTPTKTPNSSRQKPENIPPNPQPPSPKSATSTLAQMQRQFNQDVQALKNSVGGDNNTIEKDIQPFNLPYPSIKKCRSDQSGYILFAILQTKDGDIKPGKPQISSFLEEEGKLLYSNVIDKAFDTIKNNPANPDKNIIYKFKFEYVADTCKA